MAKFISIFSALIFILCQISFAQDSCPGMATVTYEGKVYNTVLIGSQCWLKENLDYGTRINGSDNQTNNSIIEKYCYNDEPDTCTEYGGLYQWYEAMLYVPTTGTQGICPIGWHIPTLSEFETLKSVVNNDGNALKAFGQGTGSGAGTNTSGFSALVAGNRNGNGYFSGLGDYTYFWSSTESSDYYAYNLNLGYYDSDINLNDYIKYNGFSVRCLYNNAISDIIRQNEELKKFFNLEQNYPNPFNPTTKIKYTIPQKSFVSLKVLDMLGNELQTLVNSEKETGNYEVEWNAGAFATGIYFYQMKTDNYIETRKMILIK